MASKQNSKLVLALIVFILVGVGIYVYSDAIRDFRFGELLGIRQTSMAKDVYYCPMHPDYKSEKPGDCPICNMSLVKLEQKAQAAEKPVFYCPMHPDYKSEKPGDCPICNMSLVKLEQKAQPQAGGNGAIQITPQKQQLIGVQYGAVLHQQLSKAIRTVGRVTYDETKIARIQTKIDGWIEKVYVDFTGKLVKKGQPLISIYSPELVSTQQEYLIAKKAKDTLGKSSFKEISSHALSLYESTRERLRPDRSGYRAIAGGL